MNFMGDIGILVLRLAMGSGIACHGYGKVFGRGMAVFIQMVAGMGFPCPALFAWAAALTEFLGGLCVVVGLATRPMSCLLCISMSVAVFIYHSAVPLDVRELPLAYWVVSLALACTGPGRFSLDHLVSRGSARRLLLGIAILLVLPVDPGSHAYAAMDTKALTGEVEGRLFLRSSDVRGQGGANSARDLSGVIIYLVAQGHNLETPLPASRPVISQKNARFDPPLLVVIKGQAVDMPNDDDIDHNVFSFSKVRSFDLGVYPKGQKKSVTFDQEGPVLIFCSVHEQMNGIIYVVPNPLYAVTDSQGKFSITRVPVGKYFVRTWHATLPETVKYVEVKTLDVEARKPVRLDINLAKILQPAGRAP